MGTPKPFKCNKGKNLTNRQMCKTRDERYNTKH
jgi:hypothetical protein